MQVEDLRIALFSGNYNYVRDGANQALNRLVEYLLRNGARVRAYSPTVENPAFEATGDLVSVPSFAIPGRPEYRVPTRIPAAVLRDIQVFAPNIVHVASPEILGHRAVSFARKNDIAAVASVHTRFETYLRYYNLGLFEPAVLAGLRRFYRRCDAIVAPSESMAKLLREQGMNHDVGIWSRGVDKHIFNPERRDMAWRRSIGIADDEPVIGFVGRLVMEKGLDVYEAVTARLTAQRVPHRVIVVGDGPARDWFQKRLPEGVFVGYQTGENLGRAVASMDMFLNPSVTETFGNVTLEAMACRLPVVAATATGSTSLVTDGVTGTLVQPGDIAAYADALSRYCHDEGARLAAGQAGEKVSENYSWDRVNHALVDVYLDHVHKSGKAAARKRNA